MSSEGARLRRGDEGTRKQELVGIAGQEMTNFWRGIAELRYEYDAFLSYSSKDVGWAEWFESELRQRGINVYRDIKRLIAGGEWEPQLQAAIEASRHLLLLWSANARDSDWVEQERVYFEVGRKGSSETRRLVIVNLDSTNNAQFRYEQINDIKEAGLYSLGPLSLASNPDIKRKVLYRLEESLKESSISGRGDELLTRRARFEHWEKLGLDRVKSDLKITGGRGEVGSEPGVRDMAWEWVRMKEDQLQAAAAPRGAERHRNVTPPIPHHSVFISYSHKDKKFLDQLHAHLRPLERSIQVSSWSDIQIQPGKRWFEEIRTAVASAKVALLLVTKDFLASDFINEHELGPLLKGAEQHGTRILWVPVRACSWRETRLKDYQALISPDKPLAEMKAERDRAWVRICEEVKKAVSSSMD
jgi:hypothetical protein